jgi:hypothetical protein
MSMVGFGRTTVITVVFGMVVLAMLPASAFVVSGGGAPPVDTFDFMTAMHGNSQKFAELYAHGDNDGDGVPDVFQAALMQLVLSQKKGLLYDRAKAGLQDCCMRLWPTDFSCFIEFGTMYMALGPTARQFGVWWMSEFAAIPEVFERPYSLPDEYSTVAYGLFSGNSDPDHDGVTIREKFLTACNEVGLDGTRFPEWSNDEWGLAYENVYYGFANRDAPDALSVFLQNALPQVPAAGTWALTVTTFLCACAGAYVILRWRPLKCENGDLGG